MISRDLDFGKCSLRSFLSSLQGEKNQGQYVRTLATLNSGSTKEDCYVLSLLRGYFFLQSRASFPGNLDVFILFVFSFLGMLGVLPVRYMF